MDYHDTGDESGEEDDDDEEEEVHVNNKSHKNKGKKHDYSKVGVDNERVRKALLLATESRTNQARLGNQSD